MDKRANSLIAPSVDRMVKYANLNLVMKSLDLSVTVHSLVSVHSLEKNLVIFPVFKMRSHENLPWLFIKMLPSSNYKSAHKFESRHEVKLFWINEQIH